MTNVSEIEKRINGKNTHLFLELTTLYRILSKCLNRNGFACTENNERVLITNHSNFR